MVLNAIPNIGPVNTRRLLEAFANDPLMVIQASDKSLMNVKGIGEKAAQSIRDWSRYFDLQREKLKLKDTGAGFVDWTSDLYPKRLKTIYDPPIGLYQAGEFQFKESQPVIAIVGSRRTTLYGLRVARQFAQRLATMGFCIVSGLARGVDSAAHEGALEAGGHTVAVLGNGLDIIYPPENLELYRKLIDKGAILSEFCFGRRADRQTFPMRNRIISGLSDGVIVVESDVNGGSMITARFAAEHGRQVYAVPGRIDQSTSRGCHQLN
jgi:DNA processing protein